MNSALCSCTVSSALYWRHRATGPVLRVGGHRMKSCKWLCVLQHTVCRQLSGHIGTRALAWTSHAEKGGELGCGCVCVCAIMYARACACVRQHVHVCVCVGQNAQASSTTHAQRQYVVEPLTGSNECASVTVHVSVYVYVHSCRYRAHHWFRVRALLSDGVCWQSKGRDYTLWQPGHIRGDPIHNQGWHGK